MLFSLTLAVFQMLFSLTLAVFEISLILNRNISLDDWYWYELYDL